MNKHVIAFGGVVHNSVMQKVQFPTETHEPASWKVSSEVPVLFPHFCFYIAVSGESPRVYGQHLWKLKFKWELYQFKWELYFIHSIWCFFYYMYCSMMIKSVAEFLWNVLGVLKSLRYTLSSIYGLVCQ